MKIDKEDEQTKLDEKEEIGNMFPKLSGFTGR